MADKGFKAGLGAAVAGVTALVGAMGLAVKATFTWANELDGIQDIMGVTTDQAATFNFILRKSGVDVNTFTKSNTILAKGLVKVDGTLDTTGQALKDWGVSIKNNKGEMKGQAALLDDIGRKYASLGTQTEKVNFLTEVYGRSGADLMDFFDTLAKEGFIDLAAEKVERFGLVIDPARYENFSRSLEEIKLIGLGMAVSFTEKIMPALEGFLTWTNDLANADPATMFQMLSEPFKRLFNLTDAFNRGAAETDWAGMSQQLATSISNIDFSIAGQYIRQGISNVLQGIGTIVQEIDWSALATSLGESLKELVAGLSGYPDWDSFATGFNAKLESAFDHARNYSMKDFQSDWNSFIEGLKTAYQRLIEWAQEQSAMSPGRNTSGGWGDPNYLKSTPATPGRNVSGGRASGGAVIGGQTYFAHAQEIFSDGMFTAPANGRIDPMGNQQQQSGGMNEDRLANLITTKMAQALQQAGVGR